MHEQSLRGLRSLLIVALFSSLLVSVGAPASVSSPAPGLCVDDQYVKEGATGSGSSWDDATSNIQAAIDAAEYGDTIYVAQGTYYEGIVMDDYTQLFGGYEGLSGAPGPCDIEAYPTIINGLSQQAGRVTDHIVTMDSVRSTRLDGFTITEGSATWQNNSGGGYGGGIYCRGADNSNHIANCTIIRNYANYGGGMHFVGDPVITNCIFANNTALEEGGGVFGDQAATFINCTINDNSAKYGGGITIGYFDLHDDEPPMFINCTISDNQANYRGGGLYCYYSSPFFTNCTTSNNRVAASDYDLAKGGGVCCFGRSYPTLTNCTIYGNSAINLGGGVYCHESSAPTITNSIFAENVNYAVYEEANTSPTITNCLFYSNEDHNHYFDGANSYATAHAINNYVPGASGNVGGDPMFADAANGDFHLLPYSPCIDAGKIVDGLTTDFEGDPRPYDGTELMRGDGSDYDIGVDEYAGTLIDMESLYGGFIDQLYRDFLSRESETAGHDYYIGHLRTGAMSPEIIVRNFMDSPEFANFNGFLARCYFGLFNDNSTIEYNQLSYRIPDSEGLEYWHNEMKAIIESNGDENDAKLFVVHCFLGSAEWGGRDLGLSDVEFIEMLYERILGRESDAAGLAHHQAVLANGLLTRKELVLFFLESPEAREYFKRHTYITMAYMALLQRAPERGGFLFHMQRLDETYFDVLSFLRSIIYAPEYLNRLASLGIHFPSG